VACGICLARNGKRTKNESEELLGRTTRGFSPGQIQAMQELIGTFPNGESPGITSSASAVTILSDLSLQASAAPASVSHLAV